MSTRTLSATENFLRCRTSSQYYNNFQVTATYSKLLLQDLDILYKALRKTFLDHHIFVCNAFKYTLDGKWELRPINQLLLKDILYFKNEDDYIENGAINELFMKFVNSIVFEHNKNVPLFKLFLIGEHNLCGVFEHTIADGVSGMNFHETLLENINFVSRNPSNDYCLQEEIILDSTIFNLHNDASKLKDLPIPIDEFLTLDLESDIAPYSEYSNQLGTENNLEKWKGRFPSSMAYSLAFKLINFTAEETAMIIQRCRQEKTAITSFIEIVNLLTWQPIFGDSNYTTHKVALSLRRHLKERDDQKYFGSNAHVGVSEFLPPIKDFSWDMVREVNNNIKISANNKTILNSFRSFLIGNDQQQDNESFFLNLVADRSIDSVKISNLGLLQPKVLEGDTWNIINMVFSQDLPPSASDFILNIVSTTKGGMNIVISYVDSPEKDPIQIKYEEYLQTMKDNLLFYAKN